MAADLSFVLVNYNTPGLTRECVESIRAEDAVCEIIVVDNSEDPTGLDRGLAGVDGVRVVRSGANLGFTGGNNFGAACAEGRVLVILNNDTVVRPGTVGAIARAADSHGAYDAVTGYIETHTGPAQISCGRFPSVAYELLRFCLFNVRYLPLPYAERFRLKTWERDEVQRVDWCTGAFLALRRETYDRFGGFDERIFMYMDDVELCRRLHDAGGAVYYHPELRILHYGAQSSAKISFGGIRHQFRSTVYYFRKHHGRTAAVVFACTVRLAAAVWSAVFGLAYVLSAGTSARLRTKAGLYWALLSARSKAKEASCI